MPVAFTKDMKASPSPLTQTNFKKTGILHTIFFNRFFPSLAPRTHEVLDVTLPYVNDNELETLIEQRAYALERQLDAERLSSSGGHAAGLGGGAAAKGDKMMSGGGGGAAGTADGGSGGRGQITVQFFERKRRKAWLTRGEEEVCWETWTIKVTVAEPRTENGTSTLHSIRGGSLTPQRATNPQHIPPPEHII